jgi:hypothetical protein
VWDEFTLQLCRISYVRMPRRFVAVVCDHHESEIVVAGHHLRECNHLRPFQGTDPTACTLLPPWFPRQLLFAIPRCLFISAHELLDFALVGDMGQ